MATSIAWAIQKFGYPNVAANTLSIIQAGRAKARPLIKSLGVMRTDQEVLADIDAAFGGIPRPKHFTNYEHCEECLEHDQTLSAKPRELLTREDLGTLGWDPVTFCQVPAKAYLFPRLARELLAEPDEKWGWYGPEFISLVEGSEFRQYCNEQQRATVASVLQHTIETRAGLVTSYGYTEEFHTCHAKWSTQDENDA